MCMIRDQGDYQRALSQVEAAEKRISDQEARLRAAGLVEAEIKRVIDPLRSFHLQLKEEIEDYERRRVQ